MPVDIAFIVDSAACKYPLFEWTNLQIILKDSIELLDVGEDKTHVAIVNVGGDVVIEGDLEDFYDWTDLNHAIENLQCLSGDSNLAEGVQTARLNVFDGNRGDRLDVTDVIMVLTAKSIDHHEDKDALLAEAHLAEENGIHVVSIEIDIGNRIYERKDLYEYYASLFYTREEDHHWPTINALTNEVCETPGMCTLYITVTNAEKSYPIISIVYIFLIKYIVHFSEVGPQYLL